MITNPDAWLPFSRLARELGGAGNRKPNSKLLRRWRARGLLTPAGERIRLPCKNRSGRWHSTWRLVQEFLAATHPQLPQATVAGGRHGN